MTDNDIVYYENGKGGVAISTDAGETLMIANGKTMKSHGTIWQEVSEDLFDQLSDAQKEHLNDAQQTVLSETELLARNLRKMRLKLEKPSNEKPIRKLGENVMVVKADFD